MIIDIIDIFFPVSYVWTIVFSHKILVILKHHNDAGYKVANKFILTSLFSTTPGRTYESFLITISKDASREEGAGSRPIGVGHVAPVADDSSTDILVGFIFRSPPETSASVSGTEVETSGNTADVENSRSSFRFDSGGITSVFILGSKLDVSDGTSSSDIDDSGLTVRFRKTNSLGEDDCNGAWNNIAWPYY